MKRRLDFAALMLMANIPFAAAHAGSAPRPASATESIATPPPSVAQTGRVTDAANILTAVQRLDLTLKLEELERVTQREMIVVTVKTLGGQDVAPFTRDLGSRWGVGRNGNDGVVLLVAPNEKMVWIAVGKGLEGKLSKEACQQILDETMMPRFRAGNLAAGISAGTDALISLLR